MIEGKNSYDEIEIPNCLDSVFTASNIKAKRHQRRMNFKGYGSAAAVFLGFFLLCNNDAIYANASDIPVFGALVQFLNIGEGGKITDGVKGEFDVSGGTLSVKFSAKDNIEAPNYKIDYLTMPARILVELNGVREFDRENLEELAKQCSGIKDLYFLTVLDDSQVKIAIVLEDGMGYQINEYQAPASLEFIFGTEYISANGNEENMWTVRIPSMGNGEPLAMIKELYEAKSMQFDEIMIDPTLLQLVKTQSGLFTITAGLYSTMEEAQKAADYLNQAQFTEYTWYAEENRITNSPK